MRPSVARRQDQTSAFPTSPDRGPAGRVPVSLSPIARAPAAAAIDPRHPSVPVAIRVRLQAPEGIAPAEPFQDRIAPAPVQCPRPATSKTFLECTSPSAHYPGFFLATRAPAKRAPPQAGPVGEIVPNLVIDPAAVRVPAPAAGVSNGGPGMATVPVDLAAAARASSGGPAEEIGPAQVTGPIRAVRATRPRAPTTTSTIARVG